MKLSHLPLAALLLTLAIHSYAQQNNPFSLRWKKIKTDHFNIIYPYGYDEQGQRMANTLELIQGPEAKTMGGRSQRVSILLQNQTAVSNGFVTLAPWRSEFFGMPPQDYNFIGTNDWLNLLAVHEYRHIVQFSRSRTGVNKLVYYLFGQQGLAVSAFVAAPQWFWEGDAVVTETAFTNSGRGRIPSFNLLFRTNLQEGRVFNYNKQHLRSYKHNIPDHYVLGYNMISYLRTKTGQGDIWEKIAARAWRMPFIPFTFSRAIKKETGLNVKELYAEMAAHDVSKWKSDVELIQVTPFETLNVRKTETYTDYLYPQAMEDGSVVAVKRGIGDIDQLVLLTGNTEEKLFVLGPVNSSGQLSMESGQVVWNEMRFDPRWRLKSYSIVQTFNLHTGRARQLTHRSRYAASALSPDGKKVATVETSPNYQTRLVILDYVTGAQIMTFENPENAAIAMPRWVDNQTVMALRTLHNRKSISSFETAGGTTREVLASSGENVGYPVPFKNYVFYNSPYSGIDNIYVLDRESGNRFQVTSSKYGAYNACVSKDGQWMYYNEQTRNGFDVVRIPLNKSNWKPLGEVKTDIDSTNRQLAEQEATPDLLERVGDREYVTKPYRKVTGMFNPHSWGPYVNSSLSAVNLGIVSRDLLNTTSVEAGYQFDLSERTGAWSVSASYEGFYPIIDLTFAQGKRESIRDVNVDNQIRPITFNWTEQTVRPSVRLPLLLTRSRYNTEVVIKNGVGMTQVSDFTNDVNGNNQRAYFDQLTNGLLLTNEFSLGLSNLMKRSRRDFQSKWGQRLEVVSIGALKGSDFSASTTALTGYLFFPGLFKHHSFYTIGAYQHSKFTLYPDNYFLRNQIPRPRGGFSYSPIEDFYFGSANYSMPLWYPDFALGPFLNIQRIRSNFFFDYGMGETHVNNTSAQVFESKSYSSTGVEVRFDGNLMRLLGQFDLGFRYSYQLSTQSPHFEVIIGGFGF